MKASEKAIYATNLYLRTMKMMLTENRAKARPVATIKETEKNKKYCLHNISRQSSYIFFSANKCIKFKTG